MALVFFFAASVALALIAFRAYGAYQRGDQLPVYFQATGAGASTRLNVTGWNGEREVLTFDVTSTGAGGNTARIAGKRDGRGTIQLDFDADLPYHQLALMIEGVSGVILEFITPTKAIQTPVILKKNGFTSAVGSQLKQSYDWEMNSLAGQFVYPTF